MINQRQDRSHSRSELPRIRASIARRNSTRKEHVPVSLFLRIRVAAVPRPLSSVEWEAPANGSPDQPGAICTDVRRPLMSVPIGSGVQEFPIASMSSPRSALLSGVCWNVASRQHAARRNRTSLLHRTHQGSIARRAGSRPWWGSDHPDPGPRKLKLLRSAHAGRPERADGWHSFRGRHR